MWTFKFRKRSEEETKSKKKNNITGDNRTKDGVNRIKGTMDGEIKTKVKETMDGEIKGKETTAGVNRIKGTMVGEIKIKVKGTMDGGSKIKVKGIMVGANKETMDGVIKEETTGETKVTTAGATKEVIMMDGEIKDKATTAGDSKTKGIMVGATKEGIVRITVDSKMLSSGISKFGETIYQVLNGLKNKSKGILSTSFSQDNKIKWTSVTLKILLKNKLYF